MNAMQPPQSVEEIKAGLETTEKGGVRQSIRNCLTVFQRDPLLSGAIAYNILTDRKDIIKPIGFHRESTALNDTDMKYLLLYLEETYGLTNEKKIDNAIGIVANENKYHPIRDYLNTLVWDGTERIRFCLRHFLGADADDYTYEALKLFLLGAISRAFQPGCKFEIMLCLVGGQGAGKSTFFRLLAVRDEWFSDDLRKLDDDNVYRKLQGHWIIEMSEMMATANAKSIEEIKSFLSRQKEVYKIPYETHPADRPRQCVFGGTSNALDFLPLDRSGNRRFIPVMVYPEQAEVHILEDEAASRAYIEQMWAEAMEIYRSGRFKLAFSPAMQRYLKEHQRDFMPEDTKAGMIQAYLDKYTGSMVCSKQLYKEALNHAFDEPKQWEIREINEIILNVKLVNKGLNRVIGSSGLTEDEMERYRILLQTSGNRPDIFGDDIYAVTGEYTDYDIPGEALTDTRFANMIREAEKYLGYPYVWGGSSPSTSFDCSGFVSWVINNCGNGWSVGRLTANGLMGVCDIIPRSSAKPGDLIFFQGTYDTSGASHVGIYVGNGMMIHCGNPISYASIETSYWQQHFYCFGRIRN